MKKRFRSRLQVLQPFLLLAMIFAMGCGQDPANLTPIEVTNVANRQAAGRFSDIRELIDQTTSSIEQGDLETAIRRSTDGLRGDWQSSDDDLLQQHFAELAYWRGVAYLRRNFPQIAIADFNDAVKFGNDDLRVVAYTARAEANVGLVRWSRVVEDCTESIRLKPDSAQAFLLRGQALQAMGQFDRADRSIAEAQKLNPEIQAELPPTIVMKPVVVSAEDASTALESGNADLAREIIGKVIFEQGSSADRELVLANANLNLTDYDATIAACSRAIQFDPQNADAYYLRGIAQLRRNRLDQAILDLSTAVSLNESMATLADEHLKTARMRGGIDPRRRAAAIEDITNFADSITVHEERNEHDIWLTELMAMSSSAEQARFTTRFLDSYTPHEDAPLNWLADYLMLGRWAPGVRPLRIYLENNSSDHSRVTQLLWQAVATSRRATENGVNLFTDLAMYAINYRFQGVLKLSIDQRLCSISDAHLYQAIDCDDLRFLQLLLPAANLSDREISGLLDFCIQQDRADHIRLIVARYPRSLTYQVVEFLEDGAGQNQEGEAESEQGSDI